MLSAKSDDRLERRVHGSDQPHLHQQDNGPERETGTKTNGEFCLKVHGAGLCLPFAVATNQRFESERHSRIHDAYIWNDTGMTQPSHSDIQPKENNHVPA